MSATSRPFRLVLLVNLLLAGSALAQIPTIPTSATVGVPYSFDFGQGFQGLPQIGSESGVSFSWGFTATGSLPPGLTFTSAGLLSGTPTTPGTYTFNVAFSFMVSAMGFSQSYNSPPAPFTITVTGNPTTGPQTTVLPGLFSFPFTSGAAASTQLISVLNRGSAAAPFTTAATTRAGGNWLTATASGSAPAFGGGAIQVTADPTGIAPGTYGGNVAVTVGSTTTNVSVVMTVSGATQLLSLSQAGLTFRALAGGGAPPPQTFNVLNIGSGSLPWTLKTSTLSGGASWLSASPANGSSGAGSAPTVQVTVNPAGLAAGDYYGQVQISSTGISNSPQTVSVVLTVAPATTTVDPVVAPTGLIFVGALGGANPAAKTVTITNITSAPATFSNASFANQGKTFFAPSPASGTVTPNQPMTVSVQPSTSGLAAGVYTGDLAVHFNEANTTHHVAILLVVLPAGVTVSALKPEQPRLATGCAPTKLYPVFTQLGQSFVTTAAWPTALEVTVVDDCGTPMTSGSVVANFSTGDPLLSLSAVGSGRWTGTWQARNATNAAVTITVNAQLASPPISGTQSIGGNSQANATVPVISADGPQSPVSLIIGAPLSPGSLVTIKGSNLGKGLSVASDLPLGALLNGTQVLIAGELMPLASTSDGQINGVVPFDVPINTTHQVIVQRGNAYSVPGQVTISEASPAVFTADMSGTGLGVFTATDADGNTFTVDENDPVTAGDSVVIQCTGLGPVTPAVASGAAAPDSSQTPTNDPVTVTIGGQDAPVSFAGLAPGLVGIYQVNVTIPDGIMPGDAQLVITVAGQTSPPVTIPVQAAQ